LQFRYANPSMRETFEALQSGDDLLMTKR